jgi:hypothetical protein
MDSAISKEVALAVLDDDKSAGEVVLDEQIGTSRWSVIHRLIIRVDGKLYGGTYRRGATESQEESPWEYTEPNFVEVEAYEKTVTDYRPLTPVAS